MKRPIPKRRNAESPVHDLVDKIHEKVSNYILQKVDKEISVLTNDTQTNSEHVINSNTPHDGLCMNISHSVSYTIRTPFLHIYRKEYIPIVPLNQTMYSHMECKMVYTCNM